MSQRILDLAKKSSKQFLKKQGQTIFMTDRNDLRVETVGFSTNHWIEYETEGNPIDSKSIHICVDEDDLTSKNYTLKRNDEVDLRGHKIELSHSGGQVKTFVVDRWFPDRTLGLIVCILGDYE